MYISEKLKEYISNLYATSNVLLTDSEKVLLEVNFDYDTPQYLNQKLSKYVKDIFQKWNLEKPESWTPDKPIDITKLLWIENDFKEIVENDNIFYTAQAIYPIFLKDKLDGLIIFFRTKGCYVTTSLKPQKTIRYFTERIHNDYNNS